MIYSRLFTVASVLVGLASAQTSNFTTCCAVDPNTVDAPTRASWCRAQMNSCPEVCQNGQTSVNKCDSTLLTYECTCQTGNTPNISDYAQTLPSLECDEWKAQCTAAHPNDLAGQTFCQSFICGSKNASASSTGSTGGSASSAVSSAASSATASGSATSAAPAATSSSAAVAALQFGKAYGTQAVAVGLLALFGLAL